MALLDLSRRLFIHISYQHSKIYLHFRPTFWRTVTSITKNNRIHAAHLCSAKLRSW